MTREQMIATLALLGWEPWHGSAIVNMGQYLVAHWDEEVRRPNINLHAESRRRTDMPDWNWLHDNQLLGCYNRVMEWTAKQ